jgi:hypothetical protein
MVLLELVRWLAGDVSAFLYSAEIFEGVLWVGPAVLEFCYQNFVFICTF